MQYLSKLEILDQLKALAEQPNFKSAFKTFFYQEWDYEIDLAEYIADQYDDLKREDVQNILEMFDDVDDVISEICSSIYRAYKRECLETIQQQVEEELKEEYRKMSEPYKAKLQTVVEMDFDSLVEIQAMIAKIVTSMK